MTDKIVTIDGQPVASGNADERFANKLRDLMAMNERGELKSLALVAVNDNGEAFEWFSFETYHRHIFLSTMTMMHAAVTAAAYDQGSTTPRIG